MAIFIAICVNLFSQMDGSYLDLIKCLICARPQIYGPRGIVDYSKTPNVSLGTRSYYTTTHRCTYIDGSKSDLSRCMASGHLVPKMLLLSAPDRTSPQGSNSPATSTLASTRLSGFWLPICWTIWRILTVAPAFLVKKNSNAVKSS